MRRWTEASITERDLFFFPDTDSDLTTAADLLETDSYKGHLQDIDEEDWIFIEIPDVPEIKNRELSLREYIDILLPDRKDSVDEGRISIVMGHVGQRRQGRIWRLRTEYRRNKALGLSPVRRDNEVVWIDYGGEIYERYLLRLDQ